MTLDWWTLGIQTVNVVILVWLLQHFFWRPVAAMIEQRRALAQKTVDDAAAGRIDAASANAGFVRIRAGFDDERRAILADAHKAADGARAAALDDATRAAASLLATAQSEIGHERADAERGWADRSSQLAVEIAQRLASRLAGPQVQTAFLEWLVAAIQAMPAQARQDVTADGVPLVALSAAALDPAQQERAGALIGKAFGTRPRIVFEVDPALIAGLELHGQHFTVGNSWRADLGTIQAALTDAGP